MAEIERRRAKPLSGVGLWGRDKVESSYGNMGCTQVIGDRQHTGGSLEGRGEGVEYVGSRQAQEVPCRSSGTSARSLIPG